MNRVATKVSQAPYVERRVVPWGHCDPAGIIYTPRALDFALETIDGWQRHFLGHDWRTLLERELGLPAVRAEVEFITPFRAGDEIELGVEVTRLGRASIEFLITARAADGAELYRATLVMVLVTAEPYRATPWPAASREAIEAYMAACRAAAGSNS